MKKPPKIQADRLFELVAEVCRNFGVSVRLHLGDQRKSTEWSKYLTTPSTSYFEIENHGPELKSRVSVIEIWPIEEHERGRLLEPIKYSRKEEIEEVLSGSKVAYRECEGALLIDL